MDDHQLPDDLSDFNLEELLNLSFDLDSLNSIDETSNEWLDELTSSITFENNELSARMDTPQEDQTAGVHNETVGVDDEQNQQCIDVEQNHSPEQSSNHTEVITLRDAVPYDAPLSPPLVHLETENIAFDSSWTQNNQLITKTIEPKVCLSKNELSVLEHEFKICHYPDRYTRKKLALALNLTQLKVSEWFTNRRIKMRKQLPVNFSTLNEYSGQNGRANRISFSKGQLAMLEREFQKCQNPDCLARQKLALLLGLRDAQVNNWFQNRRTKMRKLMKYDQLSSLQTKLITFSASERPFLQQDFDKKVDINNNQLLVIEHMLEKCQSHCDAVSESVSTFNFSNQLQEPQANISNLSSSVGSNQGSNQKTPENFVQWAQLQSKTCGLSPSNGPSKRKRKRTCYSKSQFIVLEHEFKKCQYPNSDTICKLASTIDVTDDQVRVWFKNRRSKQKNLEKYGELVQPQTETLGLSLSGRHFMQKNKRTTFCKKQLIALEHEFKNCQYPDLVAICQLASKINLTNSQVRRWFTIRRAKQRILEKHAHIVQTLGETSYVLPSTGSPTQKYRPERIVTNTNRHAMLEREFSICQYPERHTREKLASALNLTVLQVTKWFENQRTKMRKLRCYNQLSSLQNEASSLLPSTEFRELKFLDQKTSFNENHINMLENEFRKCQYPNHDTLAYLASIVNMPYNRISNWFRTRRSKQRKLDKSLSTGFFKSQYRTKKTKFNASQLAILEHEFEQCQYLDYDTASSLATIINVPYDKIRTWFINRRAKRRKMSMYNQSSKTEITSLSSSSKFDLIEEQSCNQQLQQYKNDHPHPIIRADDGNKILSNGLQQMRVFPQNLQLEGNNNSTSFVLIQQSYGITTLPLIQEAEFYINPTPPSAQYVLSHTYDAPVNSQNFIL